MFELKLQKVGFFENIFPCRTRKYGTEGREEGKKEGGEFREVRGKEDRGKG